uniref:AMP-binding enzyme n=1 Tax=Cupriavidus necator TaxID=106590 RepID=UPI003F492375
MQHPGILEACAVGVPIETAGEAVKLLVVRRDLSLLRGSGAGPLQGELDRLQGASLH